MPAPLSPPPSTDTGALTYPRTLQRWLDDNPVTPLERVGSYITLPAFSVDVDWLGYSNIVAAFNFEGPNNFSLKTMSVFSSDPNYLLAIMWSEEDGTTHRYVFWSGVGEVMPIELIPYDGQLIKKNFRFEVWSVNSTPAVQSEALTFYTSVLGGIDYRYGSDFILVSADTIVTNFQSYNTPQSPIATGLQYWYSSTSSLDYDHNTTDFISWTDSVNGIVLAATTNANVVDAFDVPLVLSVVSANYISAAALGVSYGVAAVMFALTSNTTGNIYNDGTGGISLSYDSGTGKLNAFTDGVSNVTLDLGTWYVALLSPADNTIYLYDVLTNTLVDTFNGVFSGTFDDTLTIGGADVCVAEVVQYNIPDVPLNDTLAYNLVGYMCAKYFVAFTLPLTFPSNAAPTMN